MKTEGQMETKITIAAPLSPLTMKLQYPKRGLQHRIND